MMGSSASEDIVYTKGYLLNVSAMKRYCLSLKVKKSVSSSCQSPFSVSLGNMGWMACVALCLCADLASLHIVCHASIHSRQVDSCSC